MGINILVNMKHSLCCSKASVTSFENFVTVQVAILKLSLQVV